jgi:2-methylcitrate dehydratase PrpD
MIGGSAMEGIPAVVNYVQEKGGRPESFLICYCGKVPASEAAMAMGPMSRAMDYAQIHPEALHCSEHILPPLLAAAGLRDKVNGKAFLTAFTLGQEVGIRIGIGAKPMMGQTLSTPIGAGHYIFGAVAGVGKLIDLTFTKLQNAEGIAREMTQPHDLAMLKPHTHMVKVHHGFIAQDAVNACLLAQVGITGPCRDVLSGQKGYLNLFKWKTDSSAITKELGERWDMLDAEVKQYAGTKFLHTSIFGIIDQMTNYRFNPEDIVNIHIEQASLGWNLNSTPEARKIGWNPQTFYDCQYSLPFLVASAAYDKDVFISSFEPEYRDRSCIRDLMVRISASENTNLPDGAAKMNTTLRNGTVVSNQYHYHDLKGHRSNLFSGKELINKFRRAMQYSAYCLSEKTIESVIDAVLNLETVSDVVSAIIRPLSPEKTDS